jgi:hypothetical protein
MTPELLELKEIVNNNKTARLNLWTSTTVAGGQLICGYQQLISEVERMKGDFNNKKHIGEAYEKVTLEHPKLGIGFDKFYSAVMPQIKQVVNSVKIF